MTTIDDHQSHLRPRVAEVATGLGLVGAPVEDIVVASACAAPMAAHVGRYVVEARSRVEREELMSTAARLIADAGLVPRGPSFDGELWSVYDTTGDLGVRVWPDGRVLVSGQTGCVVDAVQE